MQTLLELMIYLKTNKIKIQMTPIRTGPLYDIICKCADMELQPLSLHEVKEAYASLGLKKENKKKSDLIMDICDFLSAIPDTHGNGNSSRHLLPTFNLKDRKSTRLNSSH